MTESSVRPIAKSLLPVALRRVLRACLHYVRRLHRWVAILSQIRGKTPRDQRVLIRSALYAPVVSFRRLLSWQDPVLVAPCDVIVNGIGEFRLRPYCDDLWHVLPRREQSIFALLQCTLKSGDVFIDAGANIGIYTVLASHLVGPAGKVISIEMMPDTADRLESHVRLNRLNNVHVVRNALSEQAGQTIVATVQPDKWGQATISADVARPVSGKQVSVKTTTLDALSEDISAVRLMKVDLEGAELMALRGGTLLLERLSAVIYESWGWKRSAGDPVDGLLCRCGFELRQINRNNWIAIRPE